MYCFLLSTFQCCLLHINTNFLNSPTAVTMGLRHVKTDPGMFHPLIHNLYIKKTPTTCMPTCIQLNFIQTRCKYAYFRGFICGPCNLLPAWGTDRSCLETKPEKWSQRCLFLVQISCHKVDVTEIFLVLVVAFC